MPASPRVSEGSELGSYRILRKLGEGGMGAVFEAVHTSIGRHAAIKVLHAEHAVRADLVQRFFNEARAVNMIDHPALVQSWDFGQSTDGTAYIVMEFLRGDPLSKKIKQQGAQQIAEALEITRQIAGALSAVHAQGIVHRDLKPDNVILVPNADGSGRLLPKLLDFGIAKLMEGKQAGDVQTSTDMVLGTPAYMSPEQCRGANKVDGRADVYSLGVMLYEMLTGRRPFIAEGSGAVFGMHMYEEPAPIRDHAPHVPEAVAALAHRLMIKDRNLRPTSSEVVQLIQNLDASGVNLDVAPPKRSDPVAPAPSARSASDPSSTPTTLGSSAGQSAHRRLRGRVQKALIGAAVISTLTLSAVLIFSRVHSSSPTGPVPIAAPVNAEKNAAASAPRTVVFDIVSDPPGAEVVNKNTGNVLGATPLSHKQVAAPGQVVLSLRRSGYQPIEITLDGQNNHQVDKRLQPLPRSALRASEKKSSASPAAARREAPKATSSPAAKPEAPRARETSSRPNVRELLEK